MGILPQVIFIMNIIEFIILDYLQMIINIDLVELEDLPWLTYYKTLFSSAIVEGFLINSLLSIIVLTLNHPLSLRLLIVGFLRAGRLSRIELIFFLLTFINM